MRFYINDSATAAGSSAPATGNKKSFEINALGSNTVGIANVTGSGVTGSPAMNLVWYSMLLQAFGHTYRKIIPRNIFLN